MTDKKNRRIIPVASSETVSRRMRATGQKDTAAEMLVRRALHGMGLRYRLHLAPLPNLHRKADIIFPSRRIAVMIDGCFWHGCPLHGSNPKTNSSFWHNKIKTNKRRDRDTNRKITKAGWKIIRVWEHEDPSIAAERIAQIVRGREPIH